VAGSSVQRVPQIRWETEELQHRLKSFAKELTPHQLHWASGYLAALADQPQPALTCSTTVAGQSDADEQTRWRVLFASETGNCQAIAEELAHQLQSQGNLAEALDLSTYPPRQLRRETHTLFVVATHGLGDPPEGTQEFFETLFD